MVIALQLRYFKIYSGINYIPLSNGQCYNGIIGDNGAGKSSVLEGLDSYFNGREWNLNIQTKRSGYSTTTPSVIPVFLINKKYLSNSDFPLIEKLSEAIWNSEESDIIPQNRIHYRQFRSQVDEIEKRFRREDYYIVSIGDVWGKKVSLGIFSTNKIAKKIFIDPNDNIPDNLSLIDNRFMDKLVEINEKIRSIYDYIFIPKDVSPVELARIERTEVQSLMGESLNDILKRIIKNDIVNQINLDLKSFLDQLSSNLEGYAFRTPTDRQQNLKKNDIYSLIINAFFNIRKLHKSVGDNWLELGQLSSGEQQKALIDLASKLVESYRKKTNNLIIAIDEPEVSLHMSACFDQFQAIYNISENIDQLLFATHWYGFIPISDSGNVTIISKKNENHEFDQIDLYASREKVKQKIRSSRGKLPFDVRLKGANDFIQSIVSSIIRDEPYNWLICEGSSEKAYFDYYFSDLKDSCKLRIIPVGGAGEVKKIYKRLFIHFEEFKSDIKGKVYLLSDTDAEINQYVSNNPFHNLLCKRMVNDQSLAKVRLINIESNPVSPETEIENALNGLAYLKALKEFKDSYSDQLSFIEDYNENEVNEDVNSYFALDLKRTEIQKIDDFFNLDDNKMDFAQEYLKIIEEGDFKIPQWISEIRDFFKN